MAFRDPSRFLASADPHISTHLSFGQVQCAQPFHPLALFLPPAHLIDDGASIAGMRQISWRSSHRITPAGDVVYSSPATTTRRCALLVEGGLMQQAQSWTSLRWRSQLELSSN
jgi:hypothetical protein